MFLFTLAHSQRRSGLLYRTLIATPGNEAAIPLGTFLMARPQRRVIRC
jgi:hypothetical protein